MIRALHYVPMRLVRMIGQCSKRSEISPSLSIRYRESRSITRLVELLHLKTWLKVSPGIQKNRSSNCWISQTFQLTLTFTQLPYLSKKWSQPWKWPSHLGSAKSSCLITQVVWGSQQLRCQLHTFAMAVDRFSDADPQPIVVMAVGENHGFLEIWFWTWNMVTDGPILASLDSRFEFQLRSAKSIGTTTGPSWLLSFNEACFEAEIKLWKVLNIHCHKHMWICFFFCWQLDDLPFCQLDRLDRLLVDMGPKTLFTIASQQLAPLFASHFKVNRFAHTQKTAMGSPHYQLSFMTDSW